MAGNRTRVEEDGSEGPWQPAQFHETTILTAVSGQTAAVTFGVVPRRSLAREHEQQLESLEGLVAVVGGEPDDAIPLPNAWSLTAGMALMLDPAFAPKPGAQEERLAVWAALRADAESGVQFERFAEPSWWSEPGAPRPTPPAVAESLLLSAEIPVEGSSGSDASPLSGRSIWSILSAAGGGELVVAVVAGADTPWLLIAAPAGVILMNSAGGLGASRDDAARDLVRDRLLRWLAPGLFASGA